MNFPKSTIDIDLELRVISYLLSDPVDTFCLKSDVFTLDALRKIYSEIVSGSAVTAQSMLAMGLPDRYVRFVYECDPITSVSMERSCKTLLTMYYARKKYYEAQVLCQKIARSSPSELSSVVGDVTLRESVWTPGKVSEMLKSVELPNEINFEPRSLNDTFRFFDPGWVAIIAASTGVGKTSTAIQLSRSIAEHEGSYSIYFSLEMPIISYLERCTSIAFYRDNPDCGYRDWLHYRKRLTKQDLERYGRSDNEIVVDRPGLSIGEIKAQTKKLITHGFNILTVVIDHIYVVKPSEISKTENESQARIAIELDELAKELGVRVLAVCQTRKGEKDDRYEEPHLGDIRGSKSLSEMAWWVLMLWRSKNSRDVVHWKCAKQRYGEGVGNHGTLNSRGTYLYDDFQRIYNPAEY